LENPDAATEEWKTDAMTDAKHEGITKVVGQMIHVTHVRPEHKRQPNKVAVEAFRGVVGFNDYPCEDMAFEEKDYLNDEMGVNMFQLRLFLKCREIDWKKALKEGRDFHDYRPYREGRNYFMEKAILQGTPVPPAHAGHVIPEFPQRVRDSGWWRNSHRGAR